MDSVNGIKMSIPQISLSLGQEEIQAVSQVIASGWITEGVIASEFSHRLNDYMKTPYGVFAPNGTLALFLGLAALGIGPGDEVLVPDITFIGSANAVLLAGAKPVFIEVNRYNFQLDVSKGGKLLSNKTRAIMPVHLFGMTANMDEVIAFAKQNNLFVIEDAAQAMGVRYRGRHAGTFGEVGCFSFFADKTITTGEGGYVICQDKAIYERMQILRNQGRIQRGSFIHRSIGFNLRFTDVQAAIGLTQLNKIHQFIEQKRTIMEWYKTGLDTVSGVDFLEIEPKSTFVPFREVLLCKDAHRLVSYLKGQGIQVRDFFYPLHKQPCFAYLGKEGVLDLRDKNYPNAVYGYKHGILLPIFPTLTENQVVYICEAIKHFYERK